MADDTNAAADAQRRAAHAAHPYSRVMAALADLNAKRVDLHDRIHAAHRGAVTALQILAELIPPPKGNEGATDGKE